MVDINLDVIANGWTSTPLKNSFAIEKSFTLKKTLLISFMCGGHKSEDEGIWE